MKTQLLNQARELNIDERIQLVEAIWDSIAEQNASPMTDSQKSELARRLAEHETNPDDVVSWDDVKASALARIGR